MITSPCVPDSLGVILAGGQSRRMGGGDKFLLEFEHRPLIDHVIERAHPQVESLLLNINQPPELLAPYHAPILNDGEYIGMGPIAGIVRSMIWAQQTNPNAQWLVVFAADSPLFPLDFASCLFQEKSGKTSEIMVAQSNDRAHYTFSLWPINLLDNLKLYLNSGQRSLHGFICQQPHKFVLFEGHPDPFFNVNTPEDWAKLQG